MPILHSDMVNRAFWLNRGLEFWGMNLPAGRWGGGLTFRDIAGGHHGTLSGGMGSANWVGSGGRPGGWGALDFNGAGEQVVLPDVDYKIENGYSLTAWARTASTITGHLLSRDDNGVGRKRLWQFRFNADGKIRFTRFVPQAVPLTSANAYNDNLWHHVVATFSTSTGSHIYVDGVLDGTSADIRENVGGTGTSPAIGTRSGEQPFELFIGQQDDHRIYSRELSAQEVRALFDESRQGHLNALRWVRRPRAKAPVVSNTHPYYFRNNVIRRRAA